MAVKRKHSDTVEEEPPPLPDEPLPPSENQPSLPEETPLPNEPFVDEPPPLPDEPLPSDSEEPDDTEASDRSTPESEAQESNTQQGNDEPDAWQAIWEPSANAYYFYNTETNETTWLNPRIPREEAEAYIRAHPPNIDSDALSEIRKDEPPAEIYDSRHGVYSFTARFNAKTGKWQNNPEHTAENFSTQGQLMRTAREYFDVSQMMEGRAVGQNGGALKAERRTMKIPKAQLKELIRRKREKKDRNKREWYKNDDIIVRKH